MISRISGKLARLSGDRLYLELNGIHYEVLIPRAVMGAIERTKKEGDPVELVVYHYYQVDPSRQIPVLVGFLNEIEKEFFECFITVSGIGPKAAVKALTLPFSVIARAIDDGDVALLRSLPGIGAQRSREIVAKLQGKVGKFGLIRDAAPGKRPAALPSDLANEAMTILHQLEYSRAEAERMIRTALERNPDLKTVEELLEAVYRQKGRK